MVDDSSPDTAAVIAGDSNKQLSLPPEIVNRGLELAAQIERQPGVPQYQNPIRYFPGTHAPSLIDFSKSGEIAAIIRAPDANPELTIWNVTAGNISVLSSQEHGLTNLGYMGGGQVWSMALSDDGDMALVGYDDEDILCWDIRNHQILSRHVGGIFQEPASFIKFLPDNQWYVAYNGYNINLFDTKSGKFVRHISTALCVDSLAFSDDGNKLLAGGDFYNNVSMEFLDIHGKHEPVLFKNALNIRAVATFPGAQRLLSVDKDGLITLWNSTNGEEISHWSHAKLPAKVSDTIPEEEFIYFPLVTNDPHTSPYANYQRRVLESRYRSVAVSPDGERILSGGGDKYMRLWTSDGHEVLEYPHHTHLVKVAFLPDGQHALSGCRDGSVYLWELPSH